MKASALVLWLALAGLRPAPVPLPIWSVKLYWTAVGDDSLTGRAAYYDLRYARAPITAQNFSSVARWRATPVPAASGSRESVTVRLFTPGTYYFAIRAVDDSNNVAPLSNIAVWSMPFPAIRDLHVEQATPRSR